MRIIGTSFDLSSINTKWVNDYKEIEIQHEYYFWVAYELNNTIKEEWLCIEPGWRNDGGSIPDFVYNWIPFSHALVGPKYGDTTLGGFVLHDFLYFLNWISRKLCDMFMNWYHRDFPHSPKVPYIQSQLIYRNVRAFGGTAWNDHKKRIEKENSPLIKAQLIK